MPMEDPGEVSRRRADLEAQLRALEERRDRLEEQLATSRLENVHHTEGTSASGVQESVLKTLETVLTAVQPILGMAASAREELIVDRMEAVRGDDSSRVDEATKLLDEIDTVFRELTGAVGQLNTLAETIRATSPRDAGTASKEPRDG